MSCANSKGSLGVGEAVALSALPATLLLLAGVASSSPLGTRPFLIPFVHVLKNKLYENYKSKVSIYSNSLYISIIYVGLYARWRF